MKTILLLSCLSMAATAWALNDYLRPEDQPYYQNDANGKNNLDRIDSDVKEINKLWGEVIALKAEIKALKEQLASVQAAQGQAATKKPQ